MSKKLYANTYREMRVWCVLGLLLSIYMAYVKIRAENDPEYYSICDFCPESNCTAAFTSIYGSGFGFTRLVMGDASYLNISNGFIGIIFYSFLLVATLSNKYSNVVHNTIAFSHFLTMALILALIVTDKNLCVIWAAFVVINSFCANEAFKMYWALHCTCGHSTYLIQIKETQVIEPENEEYECMEKGTHKYENLPTDEEYDIMIKNDMEKVMKDFEKNDQLIIPKI